MKVSNVKPIANAAHDMIDRAADKATELAESKDEVAQEFQALLNEGEALLKGAAHSSDSALMAARDKLQEQIESAKARFAELERATVREARRAARATDNYVHDNPWKSIAIAGGLGALAGYLISNARREG